MLESRKFVQKMLASNLEEVQDGLKLILVRRDSRNNINTLAQEFEISESRSIEILLYIMEGGVGQYRVMRDGEVIAESNEVYPNDN